MSSEVRIRLDEVTSGGITVKGLEISIDEVLREISKFPDVLDLRSWDVLLVSRYSPKIVPGFTLCALCTYGPCDLTKGRGVCGIDAAGNHVRMLTIAVSLGLSSLINRSRKMYELCKKFLDLNDKVEINPEITITTPNISLITGFTPKCIRDLEILIKYLSYQNSKVQDSLTVFREINPLDLASRMLHLGMLSHIACEIIDTLELLILKKLGISVEPKLSTFKFTNELFEKPTILYIGESSIPLVEISRQIEKMNLGKPGITINVIAATCNLVNIDGIMYLGSPQYAIPLIRLGIPDVILIDDTCINGVVVNEALKSSSIVISLSDSTTYLSSRLSESDIYEECDKLIASKFAYIDDICEASQLAIITSIRVHGKRIMDIIKHINYDIKSLLEKCDLCGECSKRCPLNLDIVNALEKLKKGDENEIFNIANRCVWCGLCEEVCPQNVKILSILARYFLSSEVRISTRAPPLTDQVIRSIGAPIVLGEIPGVIAFVGCTNIREKLEDICKIVHEFAKRGFIVLVSGCIMHMLGKYRTEEGLSLYEEYGELGRGCIINVGPCSALSEISGIAIRVANIFAGRKIQGNYEEIADYILNRVGACGIGWGAATHKILSIAVGFLRLGIPIIVGPQCSKLGILLQGEDINKFTGIDMKTGKKVFTGPAPQHLLHLAKTPEECLIMAVKLCIRPGDTSKGRAVKLSHYIDLYKRFYGKLPPDLHLFIRTEADIPITYRDEVLQYLKEIKWKPWEHISTDVTISENVYSKYSSSSSS